MVPLEDRQVGNIIEGLACPISKHKAMLFCILRVNGDILDLFRIEDKSTHMSILLTFDNDKWKLIKRKGGKTICNNCE